MLIKSRVSDEAFAKIVPMSPSTTGRVVGKFHTWCVDPAGRIEWDVENFNALSNEGANLIRDFVFKNGSALGANAIYVGLSTATLTVTTTLATGLSEQTGGGYSRKNVTNANWATTQGSANNTAAPASWTASGTAMNTVTSLFITNVASGTAGTLISYSALTSGPYTVNIGSTLNVTYTWTIS